MQADLNPAATASPDGSLGADTPQQGSRKRKGLSTSSRGVASLTAEQLEKKRANDREAQRAIRERTKRTIENLENKIRELESQQPYQELQHVLAQKQKIQNENDEIRRRLSQIMSLIQPFLAAQGLTDLASAAHSNAQAGITQNNYPNDAFMNGRGYTGQEGQLQQGTSNQYPPFGGDGQENRWNGPREGLEGRENIHHIHDNSERMPYNVLIDSLGHRNEAFQGQQSQSQHTSPTSRSGYGPITNFGHDSVIPHTPWTILPKNIASTCTLDTILLNFVATERGKLAAAGEDGPNPPIQAVPSFASLLNPGNTHRIDALSQMITDVIDRFPNISELPERVATHLFMYNMTRWMIYQTQESYERLSDFCTPRTSQIFTAHPIWIDHIPFPKMRDKLVTVYKDIDFNNFFIPFTAGLSVNWQYDPMDCLIAMGPDNDDPIINPVFDRHIKVQNNWTVNSKFMREFPMLKDTAKVKDTTRKEI